MERDALCLSYVNLACIFLAEFGWYDWVWFVDIGKQVGLEGTSEPSMQKKRLGIDIYTRGMKGGIRSIKTPVYNVSLYELLKTYSVIKMQKTFQNISIPKLPVFTSEEGIKQIKNNYYNILIIPINIRIKPII